jgi:hypothetical protein
MRLRSIVFTGVINVRTYNHISYLLLMMLGWGRGRGAPAPVGRGRGEAAME